MQATLEVESCRTDIARIVNDVFQTMLGLDVNPAEAGDSPHHGGLTATVQFLGELRGAVLLHCNVVQALSFTSLMLGENQAAMNDDVRDVLGELANVIGGNLKSLLSPGVALSLPLVAEGNDYELHLCEPNVIATVAFDSEVGVFHVTLVRVSNKSMIN